jgi:hypothetical protein
MQKRTWGGFSETSLPTLKNKRCHTPEGLIQIPYKIFYSIRMHNLKIYKNTHRCAHASLFILLIENSYLMIITFLSPIFLNNTSYPESEILISCLYDALVAINFVSYRTTLITKEKSILYYILVVYFSHECSMQISTSCKGSNYKTKWISQG